MDNIIRMEKIVKVFPPDVIALDSVSVEFIKGELHAVVGENGAGKSTLMKILFQLEHQNAGKIFYRDKPIKFSTPGEAISHGIGMVHQEIMLISEYSIWENIILGKEPTKTFGRIDKNLSIDAVQQIIDDFKFNLDAKSIVNDISIAAKQKVEILKLMYRNVEVLILDEPTAVLTPQEIPHLFDELKLLCRRGKTIIFISHHLDEVMHISDRITVLRKGNKVATVDTGCTNKKELARMMVNRDVIFDPLRTKKETGEIVCSVNNLSYSDAFGKQRLKNINFYVKKSEIVGIASVEGNGQFELVNCLIGISQADSGRFMITNSNLINSPILQRRKLMGFVPQDRVKMGASVNDTILDNLIMTHYRLQKRFTNWNSRVLNYKEAKKFSAEIRERFSVNMGSPTSSFRSLSGGNQQKIILGRELSLNAPFYLLDQPTRGLDVGSTEYIHHTILSIKEKGCAVLLISADLEEIFRICDRILVLYRGEIVANLETEKTSIEEVGSFMLQGSYHHENQE